VTQPAALGQYAAARWAVAMYRWADDHAGMACTAIQVEHNVAPLRRKLRAMRGERPVRTYAVPYDGGTWVVLALLDHPGLLALAHDLGVRPEWLARNYGPPLPPPREGDADEGAV
jgi:hypothetical protein